MRLSSVLPRAWKRRGQVTRETVQDYIRRGAAGSCVTIQPEAIARHPLPQNVTSREDLPDDRGWWGYSFSDVPERVSGETFIATLPDCRICWYRDASKGGDFFPAVLTGDGTALDMRELRFRPGHERALAARPRWQHVKRCTWIIERVYHNHSHWLTAHLPKLLLLRDVGRLEDVWLPADRTPVMDASLRLLGLDAAAFPAFDAGTFLEVDELTVVGTDRFRPELLRLVPKAGGVLDAPRGSRRIFISRNRAARRRLLNEDEVWPLVAAAGFERVYLEEISFDEQVALMRQTAVLFAPHGAGLTNMLFVPPQADVVEIADPGFPNPNFYALAAALGHRYWLVRGAAHGDCHPLEKDLSVQPAAVARLLRQLDS